MRWALISSQADVEKMLKDGDNLEVKDSEGLEFWFKTFWMLIEGDLYSRLAGMTGLHLAASDGALETVRLLLDARADAAAKDNKGAVKSLRQTWR